MGVNERAWQAILGHTVELQVRHQGRNELEISVPADATVGDVAEVIRKELADVDRSLPSYTVYYEVPYEIECEDNTVAIWRAWFSVTRRETSHRE